VDGESEPGREAEAITVVVVDDQASFRTALGELVEATEGFKLVGEAGSGEEALDLVPAVRPRMLIIDKRMPGLGGVEATRRLTEQLPDLVVVLVSVEDPDLDVARSAGAAAFIRKQDLSPAALRSVWLAGRTAGL
jgi:two-component system, NarL family, invasion response regulator UvrY